LDQVWEEGEKTPYGFVVMAFSQTKFITYFTGSFSRLPPLLFNENNFNLYIGKSENKKYSNYKGEIDDLLIYNRLLTVKEVQDLSNWNKNK